MRRKRLAVKILISLTVVLWVGGVLFCIGYRLRHPVDSYSNTQSQQQERERVGVIQQDNASPRREQADNQQSYAAKWLEPITLLTVFLVLGVVITAYIYWGQLRQMQKTVALVAGQGQTMREQLNAMKAQEGVMAGQLDAMREQVGLATRQLDAMTVTERAYIGVTRIRTVDFTIGKMPVVKITILNGGRTPAWRVKTPMTFRIGIGDDFPSERPELGNVVGVVFLPAGVDATFSAPFTFVLTPQWKAALESGARTAFIHGEVHYDDCWGSSQVFTFKFVCRKDGTWTDYKDHNQTEPIITITP